MIVTLLLYDNYMMVFNLQTKDVGIIG